MLAQRKILIGISGSIAAYKTILLVRLLVKQGAEVRVVMTPAAKDFVSPLVLSTLSKHEVLCELANDASWSNHVMLGRWADVMLIAPASCNTIAKMAHGLCDNLLMAVYLSATCPVWVAPAMDEDMWHHASTATNLSTLRQHGCHVLETVHGELASGLIGAGRMQEPEQLVEALEHHFSKSQSLAGKTALVTAGPTYEAIDPVRFIGNHSSGLMGIAIAEALAAAGAEVHLLLGPSALPVKAGIHLHRVQQAEEMYALAQKLFPQCQIAVMAAAVADYRPATAATEKIKKTEGQDELVIRLVKNPDILKWCGEHKQAGQWVVGFALETEHEEANALAKLQKKNADMMVLNSLRDAEAGFGKPTNKVVIYTRHGAPLPLPAMPKTELAGRITDIIAQQVLNPPHDKA